jgi:diaminohydroxyphosphoribosylaminopyrimidine deaminase/5-amino-6-(5-phosphoribosylamino)uracil reductase
MERAVTLASQAIGRTAPNPPVGCVLVKGGQIIGEGFHHRAGTPHAERNALQSAAESPVGATAYVTLEPCNHHGRTPPCTDAIIQAGISRVVVGASDPNPVVSGAGIQRLRDAGISVTVGVLEDECMSLIAPFVKHVLHGRPWVTLKVATTLDGKLATRSGHSQWITGAEARLDGHFLRDQADAIAVGAGTIRADDPRLTTRLPNEQGRSPLRIVVSSRLSLPLQAQVFMPDLASNTLVVCAEAEPTMRQKLESSGVSVSEVGYGSNGYVALGALLDELGRRDVMWLMVEGGMGLATEFLRADLVDELRIYQAPKLIGGDGKSWVGSLGIDTMPDTMEWSLSKVQTIGPDLRIDLKRKP